MKTSPARYAVSMQPQATHPNLSAEPAVCAIPPEHHSVYCPTCCSRLQDSRCKLICRTCGYFLSCADFY